MEELSADTKALFDLHGQGTPQTVKKPEDMTPEERIMKQFDEELLQWNGIVKALADDMRDIKRVIDVQSRLYDERHRVVDRKHKLLRDLSKFMQKYKEEHAKKLHHYTTNFDRKLTTGEREKMADADMSMKKYRIELLENHINQLDAIFKGFENMIYGLQHRLKLEEYLRNM